MFLHKRVLRCRTQTFAHRRRQKVGFCPLARPASARRHHAGVLTVEHGFIDGNFGTVGINIPGFHPFFGGVTGMGYLVVFFSSSLSSSFWCRKLWRCHSYTSSRRIMDASVTRISVQLCCMTRVES